MNEKILVIDFGSQYSQLIVKNLRNLHVYTELYPYNKVVLDKDIKGIILSGGPSSEYDIDLNLFRSIPILGICYGAQLIARKIGEEVISNEIREYGSTILEVIDNKCVLFEGVPKIFNVWMSHSDTINNYNKIKVIAKTKKSYVSAFKVYGKDN